MLPVISTSLPGIAAPPGTMLSITSLPSTFPANDLIKNFGKNLGFAATVSSKPCSVAPACSHTAKCLLSIYRNRAKAELMITRLNMACSRFPAMEFAPPSSIPSAHISIIVQAYETIYSPAKSSMIIGKLHSISSSLLSDSPFHTRSRHQ